MVSGSRVWNGIRSPGSLASGANTWWAARPFSSTASWPSAPDGLT